MDKEVRTKLTPPAGLAPSAASGTAFSVAAVLPVLLSLFVISVLALVAGEGYEETDWYKYLCFLLPQIGLMASSLTWFCLTQTHPRKIYAPCHWKYFLLAVCLAYGLFSLSWVNGCFIALLQSWGYTPASSVLPDLSGWNLLPALLVIAVLPAFFEETLFRGVFLRGAEESGCGTLVTVLLSGVLFSLYHTNPEQTLYQFVCGAVYALIALLSGSVLPMMLAHFLNNAAILGMGSAGLEDIPAPARLPVYLTAAAVLVLSLTVLIVTDRKKFKRGGGRGWGGFFLAAGAGILVCVLQWVVMLITGFQGG